MADADRGHIITLGRNGHSISEIIKMTGFSRSKVRRWIERDSVNDAARSGRPTKITSYVKSKVKAAMKVGTNVY